MNINYFVWREKCVYIPECICISLVFYFLHWCFDIWSLVDHAGTILSGKVSQFLEIVNKSPRRAHFKCKPTNLEVLCPATFFIGLHPLDPSLTCPSLPSYKEDCSHTLKSTKIIQTSNPKPLDVASVVPSHGNLRVGRSYSCSSPSDSWLTLVLPCVALLGGESSPLLGSVTLTTVFSTAVTYPYLLLLPYLNNKTHIKTVSWLYFSS